MAYRELAINYRFLHGIGSVLNVYPRGSYHRRLQQIRQYDTDQEALCADWQRISTDLERALKRLDEHYTDHASA